MSSGKRITVKPCNRLAAGSHRSARQIEFIDIFTHDNRNYTIARLSDRNNLSVCSSHGWISQNSAS